MASAPSRLTPEEEQLLKGLSLNGPRPATPAPAESGLTSEEEQLLQGLEGKPPAGGAPSTAGPPPPTGTTISPPGTPLPPGAKAELDAARKALVPRRQGGAAPELPPTPYNDKSSGFAQHLGRLGKGPQVTERVVEPGITTELIKKPAPVKPVKPPPPPAPIPIAEPAPTDLTNVPHTAHWLRGTAARLNQEGRNLSLLQQEIEKGIAIHRDRPGEFDQARYDDFAQKINHYEQRRVAYSQQLDEFQTVQAGLNALPAGKVPEVPPYLYTSPATRAQIQHVRETIQRTPTATLLKHPGLLDDLHNQRNELELQQGLLLKEQINSHAAAIALHRTLGDQLTHLIDQANRGELTPATMGTLERAVHQWRANAKALNLAHDALKRDAEHFDKFAKKNQGKLIHTGIEYPEEIRALPKHAPSLPEQLGDFFGGGPASAVAGERWKRILSQMQFTGEYPPLPPLPRNVTPEQQQDLIRKKNEVLKLVADEANVGAGGFNLGSDITYQRPITQEEVDRRLARLTPFQQSLLPIIRQQGQALRKAAEESRLDEAQQVDRVAGFFANVLSLGVQGRVGSALVKSLKPEVAALLQGPVFGQGAKLAAQRLAVRGALGAISGGAGAAAAGGPISGAYTAYEGGNLPQIAKATLAGALHSGLQGAAAGAIVGALGHDLFSTGGFRRLPPRPPLPGSVTEILPGALPGGGGGQLGPPGTGGTRTLPPPPSPPGTTPGPRPLLLEDPQLGVIWEVEEQLPRGGVDARIVNPGALEGAGARVGDRVRLPKRHVDLLIPHDPNGAIPFDRLFPPEAGPIVPAGPVSGPATGIPPPHPVVDQPHAYPFTTPVGLVVDLRTQTAEQLARLASEFGAAPNLTPLEEARAQHLQAIIAHVDQHQQALRQPLLGPATQEFIGSWSARGNPARDQHDTLLAEAERVKADNPRVAEILTQAAAGVQQSFAQGLSQSLPGGGQAITGPFLAAPYRQLTPVEFAQLRPAAQKAILFQDITNSLQVVDPNTPPQYQIRRGGKLNPRTALVTTADRLYTEANNQLAALFPQPTVQHTLPPPPPGVQPAPGVQPSPPVTPTTSPTGAVSGPASTPPAPVTPPGPPSTTPGAVPPGSAGPRTTPPSPRTTPPPAPTGPAAPGPVTGPTATTPSLPPPTPSPTPAGPSPSPAGPTPAPLSGRTPISPETVEHGQFTGIIHPGSRFHFKESPEPLVIQVGPPKNKGGKAYFPYLVTESGHPRMKEAQTGEITESVLRTDWMPIDRPTYPLATAEDLVPGALLLTPKGRIVRLVRPEAVKGEQGWWTKILHGPLGDPLVDQERAFKSTAIIGKWELLYKPKEEAPAAAEEPAAEPPAAPPAEPEPPAAPAPAPAAETGPYEGEIRLGDRFRNRTTGLIVQVTSRIEQKIGAETFHIIRYARLNSQGEMAPETFAIEEPDFRSSYLPVAAEAVTAAAPPTPEPAPPQPAPEPAPPAEAEPSPPSVPLDPAVRRLVLALKDRISERMEAGDQVFRNMTELDQFGQAQGLPGRAAGGSAQTLINALEAAVNLYIQDQDFMGQELGNIVTHLDDLLSALPTQTVRTEEKDAYQQFSTPPPLAFAAALAAGIRAQEDVLEPSAGTGNLAVWAEEMEAGQIHANEIDPERRAILHDVFGYQTTGVDGRYLDLLLKPANQKFGVILMNPPFSAAPGQVRKNTNEVGYDHVKSALKRLLPGGRLVAILGRGAALDRPNAAPFWDEVLANYHVRANISLSGSGYRKYGTSFDNQFVIIDNTGPTPGKNGYERKAAVLTGSPDTILDLVQWITTNGLHLRPAALIPAEQPAGAGEAGPPDLEQPPGGAPAPPGPEPRAPRPGRTPRPAGTRGPRPPRPTTEAAGPAPGPVEPGESGPGAGGSSPPVPGERPAGPEVAPRFTPDDVWDVLASTRRSSLLRREVQGEPPPARKKIDPDQLVMMATPGTPEHRSWAVRKFFFNLNKLADNRGQPPVTQEEFLQYYRQGVNLAREALGLAPLTAEQMPDPFEEPEVEGEDVGDQYAAYVPTAREGREHPSPMVESKSMASTPLPPVQYQHKLKPEALNPTAAMAARIQAHRRAQGPIDPANLGISKLQLERVIYAGRRHEIILPDGSRAGILVGDGTGCIAPGTRIYNPLTGEETAVEVLAERGERHPVLSLTAAGLQPYWAEAPFVKGVERLYQVTLESGRQVTVTAQHRFLTPDGWLRIADGLQPGHFLASAEDLPGCSSEPSRSARVSDAPHWFGRPEDCRDYCPASPLVRGERLPADQDNDRALLPSPADVLARIRLLWRRDGRGFLPARSRHHPQSGRPSRSSFSPAGSRGRASSGCQSAAGAVQWQPDSSQDDGQSPRWGEARQSALAEPGPPLDTLWDDWYSSPPGYYSRWDRVRSIEFVETGSYYDFHVPGPENYVAEGVVHHNSGKGRTIAAIIADNWERGIRKFIWVSTRAGLLQQAKKDFEDIGYEHIPVHDIRDIHGGGEIDRALEGVIFTTYRGLIQVAQSGKNQGERRRLQIQRWLSGEKRADANKQVPIDRSLQRVPADSPFKEGDWFQTPGNPVLSEAPQPVRLIGYQPDYVAGDGRSYPFVLRGLDGGKINVDNRYLATLKKINAPSGQSRGDQGAKSLIVYDESHAMKNAIQQGRMAQPVLQAQEGMALQAELRKARVVYSSATAMTEIGNMAYLQRLGLWGPGTAWPRTGAPGFQAMIADLTTGGTSFLEMIARDMKARGMYLAAQISYVDPQNRPQQTVEYEPLQHRMDERQRNLYDTAAQGWQEVMRQFEASYNKAPKDIFNSANKQFWNYHQSFFRQVLTALKAPTLFADIDKELALGRQAIISLIGTGEAVADRAQARAVEAGLEMSEFDLSPLQILIGFIERYINTTAYVEVYNEETDTTTRVPLLDPETGEPVDDPELVAKKQELLERVANIQGLPENPLDEIRFRFGDDAVAEITGRLHRRVRNDQGDLVYVPRAKDAANLAERLAFQRGEKKIAIISSSANEGISLHDARDNPIQARRVQYMFELNWSADQQMQANGRSHRSNQSTAPIYKIVMTDAGGETRFAATIARRLASLGALTRGERTATSSGGLEAFDYENDYGQAAVRSTFQSMLGSGIDGIEDSRATLQAMGVLTRDAKTGAEIIRPDRLSNVTGFMNRILGLQIPQQNVLFKHFQQEFERYVQIAIDQGRFDVGVQDIRGANIRIDGEPKVVFTDRETGANTTYTKVLSDEPLKKVGLDAIDRLVPAATVGWYRSRQDPKKIYFVVPTQSADKPYRLMSPTSNDYARLPGNELVSEYERVQDNSRNPAAIQAIRAEWQQALDVAPLTETRAYHLIAGTILPVWDRLRGAKMATFNVRRARLSGSTERVVGLSIPPARIRAVLQALGADSSAISVDDLWEAILERGEPVRLVNGVTLIRTRKSGTPVIMIEGLDLPQQDELGRQGYLRERVGYRYQVWISPTPDVGKPQLQTLVDRWPLLSDFQALPPPEQRERRVLKNGTVLDEPPGWTLPAESEAWLEEKGRIISDLFREIGKVVLSDDEVARTFDYGMQLWPGEANSVTHGYNQGVRGGSRGAARSHLVYITPFPRKLAEGDPNTAGLGQGWEQEDPEKQANTILNTMIHELAHNRSVEEGEPHHNAMAAMIDGMGKEVYDYYLNQIKEVLTDGGSGFSGGYRKARAAYFAKARAEPRAIPSKRFRQVGRSRLAERQDDAGRAPPDPAGIQADRISFAKYGPLTRQGERRGAGHRQTPWPIPDPGLEGQFVGANQIPEPEPRRAPILAELTRTFPHLPRRDPFYAELRLYLTRLDKEYQIARRNTEENLARIVADLNQHDYEFFSRALYILDIQEESQKQIERLQKEHPELTRAELLKWVRLPRRQDGSGHWTPELAAEMALAVEQEMLLPENQAAADAYKRRRAISEVVKEKYLTALQQVFGKRPELDREEYFHHEILFYAEHTLAAVSGTPLQNLRNRGFLAHREGSLLEYSSNYRFAEASWMEKMIHDTFAIQVVGFIKQKYDIRDTLKSVAVRLNDELLNEFFEEMARETGGKKTADELYRARLNSGIAAGFFRLGKLCFEQPENMPGFDDPRWEDLIEEIGLKWAQSQEAKENNPDAPDIRIDETYYQRLFAYCTWLLKEHGGEIGSGAAAQLFRGMREKRAEIKKILGAEVVTWRDLLKRAYGPYDFTGYTVWQPEQGNIVYRGWSIKDRIAQELLEQKQGELIGKQITRADLRKAIMLGGKKREFVLPNPLVRTLAEAKEATFDASYWQHTSAGLKRWILFNPLHFYAYNVRNALSDLEVAATYNPDCASYLPHAAALLGRYLRPLVAPLPLLTPGLRAIAPERQVAERYGANQEERRQWQEFQDWLDHGGLMVTLQTANSVQDNPNGLAFIEHLQTLGEAPKDPALLAKWTRSLKAIWGSYFTEAQVASDFREAILRFANYLSYKRQMEKNGGRPYNYGLSDIDEVKAIKGFTYEHGLSLKAWKLSNDLMGAYDEVPPGWKKVRAVIPMPFISWKLVNGRRQFQAFRNNLSVSGVETLDDYLDAAIDLLAGSRRQRFPATPAIVAGGGGGGKGEPPASPKSVPGAPEEDPEARRLMEEFIRQVRAQGGKKGRGRQVFARLGLGPVAAFAFVKYALRGAALWSMVEAYNWLFHRQQWEEAPEWLRYRPKIFWGKDPATGEWLYLDRASSFWDNFTPFGLDNVGHYQAALRHGRMGIWEVLKDMAVRQPLQEAVGQVGLPKNALELLFNVKSFPDVTAPRAIRDKAEYVSTALGIGGLYRIVARMPAEHKEQRLLWSLLGLKEFDGQESQYEDAVSVARDWANKNGFGEAGGGGPAANPRGVAAYWLKKAIRYQDRPSAIHYLREYWLAGGNDQTLDASLKSLDPLSGFPFQQRKLFLASVEKNPDEVRQLKNAYIYYAQITAPLSRTAKPIFGTEQEKLHAELGLTSWVQWVQNQVITQIAQDTPILKHKPQFEAENPAEAAMRKERFKQGVGKP